MLTSPDIFIIVLYLLGTFVIATAFSVGQGTEGFLVNKRSTKLLFLVMSIVSTNVGAGFFLSVAAEAYTTGISFGVTIIVISTVMSLTFAVVSGRMKALADAGSVHTIPELLTQRYDSQMVGYVAAVITIVGYLFVTALQFVGIGAVSSVILGHELTTILLFSGVLTIAYTAIGGIRSDFIADALSFVIMLVALAIIVPLVATNKGVDFLTLPSSYFNIFAFAGVPFFVFSILLAAVSSFMFMEIWQRVFASESARTARRAFLISALVQPLFIGSAIVIGLTASLLYKGVDKNTAIFNVLINFLPAGLRGLAIVAILAILMTTVNSLVVVGGSTLYTDIVLPSLGKTQIKRDLLLLRILTVVFGLIALAFAFVLPDLVRLLLMGAFVMMPLCPAIIWSLFDRRPGAISVTLSMVIGIAVTLVLLPRLPETAFGPGFVASLLVLIVGYLFQRHNQNGGKKDHD